MTEGKNRTDADPTNPDNTPDWEEVTLWLDADVLDRFRASGPRWKARINTALGIAWEKQASYLDGAASVSENPGIL